MEARITAELREGWKALGDTLVRWLAAHSPVFRSTYKLSHRHKTRGVGLATQLVVYSNDPLAKWKDHGRQKGKPPPPPNMLAYVRKRGLRIAGSSAPLLSQQKSIAFLIGRKIARGETAYGPTRRPNLYPERVRRENAGIISSEIKRLSARIAASLNR